MTYQQFLGYSEIGKFEVVGGKTGLKRLIRGIVSIDVADPWGFINYGDIVLISGIALDDQEADLCHMIKELHYKSGAGLAIAIGRYVTKIPKAVLMIADELQFPVMIFPFDIKNSTILTKIYHELFLLERNLNSKEKLMHDLICHEFNPMYENQLYMFGYNQKMNHVVFRVGFINIEEYVKTNSQYTLEQLRTEINDIFRVEFEKKRKTYLSSLEFEDIVALVDVKDMTNWEVMLQRTIKYALNNVESRFLDIKIAIGVGNIFSDLRRFKASLVESRRALENLKSCHRYNEARLYKNTGVYQMFYGMEKKQLYQMFADILGPLLVESQDGNTALLDTLEMYLDCNMVIGDTAEKMFFHRNTVKNRIQQIEQLLEGELSDVNYCFNLRLAFKIKRFLFSESENMNEEYSNVLRYVEVLKKE